MKKLILIIGMGVLIAVGVFVAIISINNNKHPNSANDTIELRLDGITGLENEVYGAYQYIPKLMVYYSLNELHFDFSTYLTNVTEDVANDILQKTNELLSSDTFWDDFYDVRNNNYKKFMEDGLYLPKVYIHISGDDYSNTIISHDAVVFDPLHLYSFYKQNPDADWEVHYPSDSSGIILPS